MVLKGSLLSSIAEEGRVERGLLDCPAELEPNRLKLEEGFEDVMGFSRDAAP